MILSDKEPDDEGTRWGLMLAIAAAVVGFVLALKRMRGSD